MKKSTFILLFVIFSFLTVDARQITYAYDAAGNRISRTLTLSSPSRGVNKNITEEESEPFSDMIGEQEIKIYPNPTHGYLVIEITGMEDEAKTSLGLYDTHGSLIIHRNVEGARTELNLTEQAPGTYLLQVIVGGKSTTWKIIKE